MIEREIVKDIKSYEPKFIGPFSLRQTVCVALGAAASFPVFFLLNKIFITEFSLLVASVIIAPFLICGWYKPYDIPFEKFVYRYLKTTLMTPSKRKYKTNNYYEKLYIDELKDKKESLTKSEIRKRQKEEKRIKKEIALLGSDYQEIK